MNKYEGMFLLRPDLGKDKTEKLLSQITELINKSEGSIIETKEWGRHKLGYPIKKCKEGLYYLLFFNMKPIFLDRFKTALRLNESVLRFLILRLSK